MSFWRNPEIRKNVILWAVLAAVLCTAACVHSPWVGLWTLGISLLYAAVHFGLTRRRYRALADLAREIDHILHDAERFDLARFQEGELAILHSEIYKVTVRLREQADALRRDKVYLADSIADISHQIRTPLTSIHLIANFLAEEELDDARRLALTRDLRELLARIDWLIHTLLKLSRLDAGMVYLAPEEVNIKNLVLRAAEPLMIPMELREQQLCIHATEEEYFSVDPNWTVEVIGNILKNCMEHTPNGGTVTVDIAQSPICTELIVCDSGEGFSPEDLPHLFERFYKGKNAASSSIGIGLALARGILSAQNATIKAENGRHGGAKFTMRFYKSTA